MKTTIQETQRGFLFKKGRFVKMLQPGIYHTYRNSEIRIADIEKPLLDRFTMAEIGVFSTDENFRKETVSIAVPDGQIALRYSDGKYREYLPAGKYTLWNNVKKHTFELYPINNAEVPDNIPRYICDSLCRDDVMQQVNVMEKHKGLLYIDGIAKRILEPGVYYFWTDYANISYKTVDMRQQQLSVTGQEIMTKDKVSVRLNFVCTYKVADFEKALREIQDFTSQFYIMVQMAMREIVSALTLDEILNRRDEVAAELTANLKKKAVTLYIDITDAGIRDIILPGDVRDIMNTVLIAEKRAQANVITRREEVASTRSLLNTARLMDENKTLYKLKELEYLEKICANVGNISVSGGDLLTQLREILNAGA